MPSTLYKILGIEKDASPREIKKAYRKKMAEHHPDKNDGEHSEDFYKCSEAYEILSDALMRRKYDETGKVPKKEPLYNIAREFATLFHKAMDQLGDGQDLIKITREAIQSVINDTQKSARDCKDQIRKLEKTKTRVIAKTDERFLIESFDVRINTLKAEITGHELQCKKMKEVKEYADNYEFLPNDEQSIMGSFMIRGWTT